MNETVLLTNASDPTESQNLLKAKTCFEEAEILGEVGILKEKVVMTLKKYEKLLEKIKKERRSRSFEETKEHIGEELKEIYESFAKIFVKYFDLPEELHALLSIAKVESILEVTQKIRDKRFSVNSEKDSELNATLNKINEFLSQFSQFLRNPLGVETNQARNINIIPEERSISQDQISSATSQISKIQTKEIIRNELRSALEKEKYRPIRKITTESIEIYCKKCDDYKPCMIYEYHSCLNNTAFKRNKPINPERKQAKDLLINLKALIQKFEGRFLNDIMKDTILKNSWERVRVKLESIKMDTDLAFIKKNLEELALFGDGSVRESGFKAFLRRLEHLSEKIIEGLKSSLPDEEGVLLAPSPFDKNKASSILLIDNVLSD